MSLEREAELQREIHDRIKELRELHQTRTGHPVWVHGRNMDLATRCFQCNVADNPNRSVKQ